WRVADADRNASGVEGGRLAKAPNRAIASRNGSGNRTIDRGDVEANGVVGVKNGENIRVDSGSSVRAGDESTKRTSRFNRWHRGVEQWKGSGANQERPVDVGGSIRAAGGGGKRWYGDAAGWDAGTGLNEVLLDEVQADNLRAGLNLIEQDLIQT